MKGFVIRTLCFSIFFGTSCGLECYTNTDVDDLGPVVLAKTGTIVGKYATVMRKEIPVFLGILFAVPPVGEKRFKISEPVEPWTEPLLAREKSPACMQYSSREFDWIPPHTFNFSEDCLYLNIFLPSNCCCDRTNKLPVMAFIFGGGFYSGSAMMDIYDGGVLASLGEVIVVTFNYRLNVFGFLNVDSNEAPGNQGLHDQYLALKWIHENIEHFGGDPNSVTLFGESAGSVSVSIQILSSIKGNLFQKAILESGTAALSTAVDNFNGTFNKAIEFSKLVGCSVDNSNIKSVKRDIVKCLKYKNAEELVKADNYFTSKYPAFFAPSYGNTCEDCFKFLSENPVKTLMSGDFPQIPVMIGNNKDEGIAFMLYSMPQIFRKDQKPLLTIPEAMQLLQDFFGIVKATTIPSDKIFDYYMNNISEGKFDASIKSLSAVEGDFIINCGNMHFADAMENVYYYLFNHRSQKAPDNKWIGVPHFAEVKYVFGDPIRNSQNYNYEDIKISEEIIQKFTSFAHYGHPVAKDSEPKWPKYSSSDRRVYELMSERSRITQFQSEKACNEIWLPLLLNGGS